MNKLLDKDNHPIAVIGAGFAGLSAASVLAATGKKVKVFEKNTQIGGRARVLEQSGFTFDMGPSWYWMAEVFENYFNHFGYTTSDFYELKKLNPAFRVIFGKDEIIDIPEDFEQLCEVFENTETGSGLRLRSFMDDARFKYDTAMESLIYLPGNSVFEYIRPQIILNTFRLRLFSSFQKHVGKYFKDPRLKAIMEFPVLFLGAMPDQTPALYSMMNHTGLRNGTWYPMGGFASVVNAFKQIAEEKGVEMFISSEVNRIEVNSGKARYIHANGHSTKIDGVIGAADYHHVESRLLSGKERSYDSHYWQSRSFAPSCLLFYLGIRKKVKGLLHHNLFFDADFQQHAQEIYTEKKWPQNPLFYVCCPSKTDPSVAPEGHENLFILMPVAPGLQDNEDIKAKYYDLLMQRLEAITGGSIKEDVVFKKSYSVSDFENDYNAYKGNAYGLANTLFQTAIFKPRMKSRKVRNLFFAGQLTVPGPGVPPAIISGRIAAQQLLKHLNN